MKRPSFQFYPKDFMADPNVIGMTNEEVGIYIKLLSFMWMTEDCTLPNDLDYLNRISKGSSTVLQPVLNCFKIHGDKITHKRLLLERTKQDEWREKCVIGGKRSGETRAKQRDNLKGSSTNREVSGNTSTSSSSSSPIITKETKVSSSPKKIFSDKVKKLSDFLFECIRKNNPTFRGNPRKWDEDMDKVLRIDKRPYDEVVHVVMFAQTDDFWKANILSGGKLRQKYDQLFMKAKGTFERLKKTETKHFGI